MWLFLVLGEYWSEELLLCSHSNSALPSHHYCSLPSTNSAWLTEQYRSMAQTLWVQALPQDNFDASALASDRGCEEFVVPLRHDPSVVCLPSVMEVAGGRADDGGILFHSLSTNHVFRFS